MSTTRQVAAIMFSDIIGYSKLMNRNEEAGLALLSKNREIHQTMIADHRGRFIKEMGDGVMAIFDNSKSALSCSREIYRACRAKGINLRFGIHQDEVTFQNDDVFGDGVNVASRIESLGIPNSIIISGASWAEIKDDPSYELKAIGRFNFKNIEEDIELYALRGDQLNVPTREMIQERILSQQGRKGLKKYTGSVITILLLAVVALGYFAFVKDRTEGNIQQPGLKTPIIKDNSIAVLPFVNSSNLPDQEYFSDGMMEEVLNKLYKINELSVISQTSSMRYKSSNLSTREIARQLSVANLLEGSVRIIDDSVRINIKLIDGRSDTPKWTASYDRELKSIFSLQSEIAKEVAEQLKVQINQELLKNLEATTTDNPEVWKLFMRSKYSAANRDDFEKAAKLLNEAIAIEPNFAPAHAELGYLWMARGTYLGDLSGEEVLDKAFGYLEKAKAMDPNYPITHVYLAAMNLWFKWDFEAAEKEWNAFHRLSPSNKSQDVGYVDFLNAAGRFQEALGVSNTMLANDASESASWATGLAIYFAGYPDKALKHWEEAMELFPITGIKSDAARTCVFTGNYQRAIEILEPELQDLEHASARSLGNVALSHYKLGQKEQTEPLLQILKDRSEKTPAGSPAFYTAMVLAQMGETDQAFLYLDRAYKNREVEMFWLNVEPPFAPLKNDPRWKVIIDKVGFPKSVKN